MKNDNIILRNAHLTTNDYNIVINHIVYLLDSKGLKATPGNIAEFLNKIYVTTNLSHEKSIIRTQDGGRCIYIDE